MAVSIMKIGLQAAVRLQVCRANGFSCLLVVPSIPEICLSLRDRFYTAFDLQTRNKYIPFPSFYHNHFS